MANKIVVNCFENQDCEWLLGAQLVVGEQSVELQDGLVADTESLDNMVALYRGLADGLGIPLEVDQEVTDLREGWEEEENG
jgi:hypothetical protein